MLDLNLKFEPVEAKRRERVLIDENELVSDMSQEEAKAVVMAILQTHGAAAFEDVASDVIEEYGESEE